MKSYSKLQNYLSLFMFITINILFYFKYLSKISIACGAITSVLYILFIIFLFKYKPTFGRKRCQRRYNHFYNSYFITSFLYS